MKFESRIKSRKNNTRRKVRNQSIGISTSSNISNNNIVAFALGGIEATITTKKSTASRSTRPTTTTTTTTTTTI
jgi:hypothetical protein